MNQIARRQVRASGIEKEKCKLDAAMTPMNRHPQLPIFISVFVLILGFQQASADSVKILEWNISGNELNGNITNQNAAAAIFNSENADIIALQETGSGADEIATILAADYVLAVAIDGQEIWVRSGERFQIDSTGSWAGQCNTRSLDGAKLSLTDLNSDDRRLYVYSAHFCIPDTFGGNVDINPNVSNEDQQEHLCNIIDELEANAALGVVLIAADFNDINIPTGESLISFLEGTGTLNGGFCTATAIAMTDVIRTDVTHIMGTSDPENYTAAAAGNPSFGQHGYVVATLELANSDSGSEPGAGTSRGTDGNASTAIISGRVTIDGGNTEVNTVLDTDHVAITGTVVPEPNHNGQTGALYIVIAYDGDLFFKDTSDAFITWNGELDSLGAYREGIALEASIGIDVFEGQLLGLRGSLEIFFAYSVQNILYYSLVPVSLEIEDNPS
ncbi:MAG: hypothetical protein IIB72_04275 [Proteobacteria bacterium]|nr:hypothetical protein [Pseudomonadota bacterium]